MSWPPMAVAYRTLLFTLGQVLGARMTPVLSYRHVLSANQTSSQETVLHEVGTYDATDQCAQEDATKVSCGHDFPTPTMCENKGCCWRESTTADTPWCFQTPASHRCKVPDAEKIQCGTSKTVEPDCVSRGCCYVQSNSAGVPSCFSVSKTEIASSAKFARHHIPRALERLALCNDGSPSGFYYKAPNKKDKSAPPVWLVFQEGGSWCWDEASCKRRRGSLDRDPPNLVSSRRWPSTIELGGMFSEGRFVDAHRVYIKYCTSDGYLGNRTGPMGWHFRGRAVLQATIEELVKMSMGAVSGTRLLYGGCSAGGRGAGYAIDWLQTILPRTVSLRGFLDSPLWVDLQPIVSWKTSLNAQTKAIAALYPDSLDTSCVRAYPGESWRCLMGEFSLKHVGTPSVVFVHRDDSFQISIGLGDGDAPQTPTEIAWTEVLSNRTIDALNELPNDHAVFMLACVGHCISYKSRYNSHKISGTTLQTVVERFFFERKAERYMQGCTGYNCCQDRQGQQSGAGPSVPYSLRDALLMGALAAVLGLRE